MATKGDHYYFVDHAKKELVKNTFRNQLPKKFVHNVITLCGEDGDDWLLSLPQIIEGLEEKWGIKYQAHFENLSYNFVGSCYLSDKTPAVFKIAPPRKNPEIFSEARTLQIFNGNGAVRFLKSDENSRAILLERLLPGKHLKEICTDDKEKSVEITIDLMHKLYKDSKPVDGFTTVDYWLNNLIITKDADIPSRYLSKARKIFEELNRDKDQLRFLHGDLHHENILSVGKNKYAAIDPFGINANIGYEIGLFLRVHATWVNDKSVLRNAIDAFSEAFEISSEQVKQWAYVQQVLSYCWDFEDGNKAWRKGLEAAAIWEKI